MSTTVHAPSPAPARAVGPSSPVELEAVVARACARIAPTWPLDRFIAVNPLWGMIDAPLPEVAGALGAMTGARLLMPRAWYRQAHAEGRLRDEHLAAAIAQHGSPTTLAQLHALLAQPDPAIPRRWRVADVVDADRDLVHEVPWADFVTNSVSQCCAAYFDEGQASLAPDRRGGLYARWRRSAQRDHAPALLMGMRGYRDAIGAVPDTARAMLARGLADLDVPDRETEAYLWGLLLDQQGWASWCAYRRWTARLAGDDDDAIVDLLAIRLAWEWLLHRAGGAPRVRRWQRAMTRWADSDAVARTAHADDWLLQRAMEIAWQRPVLDALPAALATARPTAPAVQAVFCIDVRSEVLRRALEAASPAVQTLGFAGFFGMPIAYQPVGTSAPRPQLPGLLAPRLLATDTGIAATEVAQRARRLERAQRWRVFKTGAVSAFTFIEAVGLGAAGALLADSLGRSPPARDVDAGLGRDATDRRRPRVVGTTAGAALDLASRCELAAGALRGMSLTRGFARLVLLAGHGSTTRNNPHAAALDCGACGGQRGEVNARAAAALLNQPEVRDGLRARGIDVPASTWFLAGLHDTTTDDVELFDVDALPPSHAPDLAALREWLTTAAASARAERAVRLGVRATVPAQLHAAVRGRARDWAQVRPEWGLADNAAFIAAPREHCRALNFAGRAFLHEYRADEDAGFATLELIMTAPMVVAHWINLQYYASTVAPARYGSGSKLLHNVVGGHLGVFEGNGGDLRIGLPLQSVHDGERAVHTPLRLSVFIEAPRAAIAEVLAKHATVRALVGNAWLDLFQLDVDERAVYAYRDAAWVRAA